MIYIEFTGRLPACKFKLAYDKNMEQALFIVLCVLCLVLQTSLAESSLIQVSQLPHFPLKSGKNDTNFEKLPAIRVFRACQNTLTVPDLKCVSCVVEGH